MKSLKERLEQKIKKESKDVFCSCCLHYDEAYETGAASLVPLVLELAEALEFYDEGFHYELPESSNEHTIPTLVEKGDVATEALQSIEKFLEIK